MTPTASGTAALLVLALTLAARPARAEIDVLDTTRLLRRATRIEILKVTGVADGVVTGVVVESIRGSALGATVSLRPIEPGVGPKIAC